MKLFHQFRYLSVLTIFVLETVFCDQNAFAIDQSTLTKIKVNPSTNNPNNFDTILSFNHKVDYNIFTLSNPNRLVIDLKDCHTAIKSDEIQIGQCPITKIKIGIQNGYDLRLVYDLQRHIRYSSLFMPAIHNEGGKLIIQFNNSAAFIPTEIQPTQVMIENDQNKPIRLRKIATSTLNVNHVQQDDVNSPQNDALNSVNQAPQNPNTSVNSDQQVTSSNENNSDENEADMINQLTIIEDQNSLKKYADTSSETTDNYAENNAPLLSAGSGNRPVIVVIDAGHGGHDPGATGPNGIHEKNITIAIARDLQYLVDQQKGMHAVMTRDGDYYVGLRDRLAIARKDKGDIFIAIHADAAPELSGEATGASVFALSLHGASSEAARWIAEKENYSELGGIDLDNIPDQDSTLRSVLIDLSQTATISDSLILGKDVLHQLGTLSPLHHNVVEQAPFMVLKSPDIPSILVETGFITTPYEEDHLADPIYQQELAHAMLNGIKNYFNYYAPPGTWLASNNYKANSEG